MIRAFLRLSKAAEARALSASLVLSTAAWVALVRLLLERYLVLGDVPLGRAPLPWFLHVAGFYLSLLLVLSAVLVVLSRASPAIALNLVGMGLVLGTLPPVLDAVLSQPGTFTYEYRPSGSVPWTLYEPRRGLPLGECAVLWLTIALVAATVARRSRAVGPTVVALGSSWLLVQVFLVGVPTATQYASAATGLAPSEWRTVLHATLSMLGLVTTLGLWRRTAARLPQVLLPVLFVVLGAALSGRLTASAVVVALHAALAGLGFTLSNDFHDAREDEAAGRPRTRLDPTTAALLMLVPAVFLLGVLAVRLEPGLCLLGFLVVAHAWQADPLRLKCVFPLSYKTEGLLAGLCTLAGIASDASRLPTRLELWAALAIAVGTPVALVFKDWKDVVGDQAAGVRTAFVVAAQRGWAPERTRRVSAALLLVALLSAVGFLAARGVSTSLVVGAGLLSLVTTLSVARVEPAPRAVAFGIVGAELVLLTAIAGLLLV